MTTLDFSKLITAEEKKRKEKAAQKVMLEAFVQRHIDDVARARNYRDGYALANFASSTVVKWATEAQKFIAWRDAVWMKAFDVFNSGAVDMSENTIIAALPEIQWDN